MKHNRIEGSGRVPDLVILGRPTSLQVVVYDLTNKPLPSEVIGEVTTAVESIVKKHITLGHTVVAE